MNLSLHSKLRSKSFSKNSQMIISQFFWFSCLMRGIFMLSTTFLFLYVVDKIGLAQAAIVITIAYVIQGLTDYPSGGIGDKIGQKNILFIAYLFHAIAYGALIFANSFEIFAFIYSFEAIGRSLESGALNSWFDNNYKAVALENDDPQLEFYREINMKMEMYIGLFASSMILIGGFLAYIIFRGIVFFIQSLVMIFIAIITILFLNDYYEKKNIQHDKYLSILTSGIKLLLDNPRLLVFVTGIIFVSVTVEVWGELILFIYYFGYSGSDMVAGIFRFVVWVFSSIFVGLASSYVKKLKVKKNLYKLHLVHPVLFYFILASIIFIVPMKNDMNLAVIFLSIFVFSFTAILRSSSEIMRKEVYIEMVPNNLRNTFYSLVPTLLTITTALIIPIFGYLIAIYGFVLSIIIIGLIEMSGALLIGISFYLPLQFTEIQPNLSVD